MHGENPLGQSMSDNRYYVNYELGLPGERFATRAALPALLPAARWLGSPSAHHFNRVRRAPIGYSLVQGRQFAPVMFRRLKKLGINKTNPDEAMRIAAT